MAVFRPSARARLQLRIDEGTDTAALEARLEKDAPEGSSVPDTTPATELGRQQELDKNRQRRRLVTRERANLSPEDLSRRTGRLDQRRNALQLGGATEQQRPQGLQQVDQDTLTIGVDIVPVRARISRNGLMEADTATVDFDFRTIPIDPRSLRAVFLDLVIGTVEPNEFEQGINLVTRDDGSLLSIVGRVPGQETRMGTTTRFVGYADDWGASLTGDGDSLSVEARDLTAPLIDEPLPTGVTIDMQRPLADGVQELVDLFAATRGLKVIFGNPGDVDDRGERGPTPAASVPKPRKARRGKQTRRARSGDAKMSVWDHIVDTVVATGYIPIIRGLRLYLIEPRTFYQGTARAKRMMYGRNLLDLEFSRKIGGNTKVPTVEVRCPDPEIGKTRWARAPVPANTRSNGIFGESDPPKATRANNVSPGGSTQEQIRVIPVSGISDGETLARIANSLYEQIGRQEIEGSWSTHDITSLDSEDEGDLLDLQPGDAVAVSIAPLNAATTGDSTNQTAGGSLSSLQELQSQTVARRTEFLTRLGYTQRAAERLALAQESVGLHTTFRVQDLTIDWDQDDGISVSCDFVNFIVAREAPGAGDQPASDEVQALTAGRTGLAAQNVRAASAAGNTTGAQSKSGEVSPQQYASAGSEERARQQRATQALRRNG